MNNVQLSHTFLLLLSFSIKHLKTYRYYLVIYLSKISNPYQNPLLNENKENTLV